MVIVDTSVWIDFLNRKSTPETLWLRAGRGGKAIGLTTLVLVEVLQGIRFERRFRQAESHFRLLPVFDGVSRQIAIQSAQNYRTLRALGVTIRSTVDCLSATFCIESGHELLHCDGDFDFFERHLNLTVLHPPPLPIP
jgi:predicted nucleic acid-binding protein